LFYKNLICELSFLNIINIRSVSTLRKNKLRRYTNKILVLGIILYIAKYLNNFNMYLKNYDFNTRRKIDMIRIQKMMWRKMEYNFYNFFWKKIYRPRLGSFFIILNTDNNNIYHNLSLDSNLTVPTYLTLQWWDTYTQVPFIVINFFFIYFKNIWVSVA